jgi:glycine C-acetyltransferase
LGENHPICPVFIGDAKLASTFADDMIGNSLHSSLHKTFFDIFHYLFFPPFNPGEGISVIGFSFPVVPKGKARIRVQQISAAHEPEEIDHHLITAFTKIGKRLGV